MTQFRRILILLIALLIFSAGLWKGFSIAYKKTLWTDELYSQVAVVQNTSWADILTGHTDEGNNSPLFYAIQKVISGILRYKPVDLWNNQDNFSHIVVRIAPVVCMSLGLALIFWFFAVYYSLLAGLIAFMVSLSSYMVWYYWAEARPYALIFLATTIQSLCLLYYSYFDRKSRAWGVGITNLFLSFISSLTVIQIAASGVLLWCKGERRVWPFLTYIGLPMMIAFGYYLRAKHFAFYFAPHGEPLSLIKANIPAGRLMAFLIIPVLIWVWDWYTNKKKELFLWPFFVWGWLTLLGYVLFIVYLALSQQQPHQGFEISNRYFMSLTPVGIIVFTVGVIELIKRPRSVWMKIFVWGVLAVLILSRMKKVWNWLGN